ncbi:response regulator transcription factor [Chthonobacter rhizosphaerae]|uniref:response regulator transcription factor n=1 Tax=Chthonobacter rhizosphaerae TaxID=2735553 RepID=UPI0015EF3BD4|nr:response regulator transcription factor [Chthonobacter rhizosphaerae]
MSFHESESATKISKIIQGTTANLTTADHKRHELRIAIIDGRSLMRECFARALQMMEGALSIRQYASFEDYMAAARDPASLAEVLAVCLEWRKARATETLKMISAAAGICPDTAVVVVSDVDDVESVSAIIRSGARGYIPDSDHIIVALQAMYLVNAGGIYIPADVLLWSSQRIKEMSGASQRDAERSFTPRQELVADLLRRGKANKTIAYELNMCESTVKVHIRTIMKKLKARNRTEAAYMINELIEHEGWSRVSGTTAAAG